MMIQRTISALVLAVSTLLAVVCFQVVKNNHLHIRIEEQANVIHVKDVELAAIRAKLGYLDKHRVKVEVTAYALTDAFGNDPVFANGASARHSYAVPNHRLPSDAVVNVALSPLAEQKLHARMGHNIALVNRRTKQIVVARFVDRTSSVDPRVRGRTVVDVFFKSPRQAIIFGCRTDFVAVNISSENSPFSR